VLFVRRVQVAKLLNQAREAYVWKRRTWPVDLRAAARVDVKGAEGMLRRPGVEVVVVVDEGEGGYGLVGVVVLPRPVAPAGLQKRFLKVVAFFIVEDFSTVG
jgi:hypothetical protein